LSIFSIQLALHIKSCFSEHVKTAVFGRDKGTLDQFKLLSSNLNCEPEYHSQGSNCLWPSCEQKYRTFDLTRDSCTATLDMESSVTSGSTITAMWAISNRQDYSE
jgi:hypothetical protein